MAPPAPVLARQPPKVEAFLLEGRIAVRQDQNRQQANITWRHGPDGDEIFVTTPLGQGVAELVRTPAGARLTTADQRQFVAADLDGLAEQVFGMRLPIDRLAAWVTGHAPSDGAGWQAEYLEYASDAADAMPILLELRRGELSLRLRIQQWSDLK